MYAPETTSKETSWDSRWARARSARRPRARSTSSPTRRRITPSTSSRRRGGCAESSAARRSSTRPTSHLLHETGYLPVWYFPRSDVRFDLLEATDHTTHCPFKGDASYWTIRAGGKLAENKVWGYPEILPGTPDITDRVAFYWDAVDHWYEEDEEVFVHPRDPYHRVDIVPSSRTREGLARRRRAGRVEPADGGLRDEPADALVPPQGGHRPGLRGDGAQHRLPVQGHGVVLDGGRQREHRLELREPDPGRGGARRASSPSTTRSSTSTSTASARSAATRPSPRPGATHSDEHRTGDARGDARAPYRHRPRELPPRRP